MDDSAPVVPARIAQLAAAFSQPEPIRRGSLCERRMKCGQATCACQDDPKAAHGPYFTLTKKVGGKTRSHYIPPEQAPPSPGPTTDRIGAAISRTRGSLLGGLRAMGR